uniref:GRF-type domain-containing protein n=1 Tax=Oryza punctata TaxID=4537 RepID=A0A0E0KQ12_ORYPU
MAASEPEVASSFGNAERWKGRLHPRWFVAALLVVRTSTTPKNPNKNFVKCHYLEKTSDACNFFMWESQYEQFLANGRIGVGHQSGRERHIEAMASMGFGALELMGSCAVGQILVYIGVVQVLLLLLIFVVVISK